MQLSWDGIVFDLLLLENWTKEATYDPTGTDFLYWHHIIDVLVTAGGDANDRRRFPEMKEIAGGATSSPGLPLVSPNSRYRFKANGVAGDLKKALGSIPGKNLNRPTNGGGSASFPHLEMDLRQRLQLPRRPLLIWMYSGPKGEAEFLLKSPHDGADTDARHGPICTIMSTPKVHGNVSGMFRLRFETWESMLGIGTSPSRASKYKKAANKPNANAALATTPALLSNRWKMSQDFDQETYLASYLIDGTAIFRMDVLKARGLTSDQLRREFMHPIPEGFSRSPPHVEEAPSGDAVSYSFADREVMTHFPAGKKYGLINIEIKQGMTYHCPMEYSER